MTYSVMLVDDDHTNLVMTETVLKKNGYNVIPCKQGTEAVVTYMKDPCPVILMDCGMPHMDGYATTESIRTVEIQQLLHPAYIIALTGKTHINDREKCKKAGMNDFIPKPYKVDDLLAKLNTIGI